MPVVALMLLGLVALLRGTRLSAGLALGAASTRKFAAWPVVLLAMFAAADRNADGPSGATCCPSPVLVVPVVSSRSPPRPVGVHRRRRAVPARPGRSRLACGQRAARGTSWCRLVPAIHRPYVIVAAVLGLAFLCPLPDTGIRERRSRRGQGDRLGDAGGHPARPGHPCRLPAVPHQPVPVGVDVPLLGRPRRARGRSAPTTAPTPVSCRRRYRTPRSSTAWTRSAWWGRPRRRPPSRSRRRCRAWPAPRWCRPCPGGRAPRRGCSHPVAFSACR